MRAAEIMTCPVVTVGTDTQVRRAAALIAEHQVTSLPVVDEDGRLVGMVSEVDLIRDRMPHDPRSHLLPEPAPQRDPAKKVGEVMSAAAVCLAESADVADIAELMVGHNVRAVPIVDGRRVVGIVSRRDLLRTLLRDDTALEAEVRQRLDAYVNERDRWKVGAEDGVVTIRGHFDDAAQREIAAVLAGTVPGVVRVHTDAP